MKNKLNVGDKVEIQSEKHPKFNGMTGTILEIDRTSSIGEEFAYVAFDNGHEDNIPIENLIKIEDNKMKNTVKESFDISVEDFFTEYAMRQIGRRKILDKKFLNKLISALDKFLQTPRMRSRKMTAAEFVNIPPPKCDDMMSEFSNWCKKNLKLDIYQNFDDYYLRDRVTDDDGVKEYDDVKFDESSIGMDPQYVIDWIGEEIGDCEWCADYTYDDYDPILEIETTDGDRFEISVKKLGGKVKNYKVSKIRKILTDDELSADAMVSEIGELVDEYESDPILKKISDVLNNEDLSAEAMVSEIGVLV